MTAIYIVFCAALVLAVLYVLALQGRKNHPQLPALRKWSYAHRGLHDAASPENSMAAFRAALEKGYGVELDIHLMADGELAVIHDSSLMRVTGADVRIEELTTEQLGAYKLCGTGESIPLFRQILELYNGQAPLIVELKTFQGNYRALCQAAAEILDRYDGLYCIESFDPNCVRWFAKNRPDVVRGQLATNFMRDRKLPWVMRFIMTHNLVNFLTRPDFIAYDFSYRGTISNFLCRRFHKLQGVAWTIRNRQDYDMAVAEGWIPIFETFQP